MGDVSESLPELINRRMGELGVRTLSALHRRLMPGGDRITYETLRLLHNGYQRNTRDPRVPRDIALMLDVGESDVRAALKIEPNFGPFELPARAQGLAPSERKVVVGVVNAIIAAKRGGTGWPDAGGSEDVITAGDVPVVALDDPQLEQPLDPRREEGVRD